MHMHRGTPYVYQGEELGMTNAILRGLAQYRDLESINMYHQRVGSQCQQMEVLAGLAAMKSTNSHCPNAVGQHRVCRLYSRIPSKRTKWISVNPSQRYGQCATNTGSVRVYSFYKELIRLRHDPICFRFCRGSGICWIPMTNRSMLLRAACLLMKPRIGNGRASAACGVNVSSGPAKCRPRQRLWSIGRAGADQILVSTYRPEEARPSLLIGRLSPWGLSYQL